LAREVDNTWAGTPASRPAAPKLLFLGCWLSKKRAKGSACPLREQTIASRERKRRRVRNRKDEEFRGPPDRSRRQRPMRTGRKISNHRRWGLKNGRRKHMTGENFSKISRKQAAMIHGKSYLFPCTATETWNRTGSRGRSMTSLSLLRGAEGPRSVHGTRGLWEDTHEGARRKCHLNYVRPKRKRKTKPA